MRSLNRVMLIGHLAADPELRQTKNGHTVTNFLVATNRILRNEDGTKREAVDFHRILAWDKLGQICKDYLLKGMAVYVEGRLANHSFEDKNGNKHFFTEVVTDELNILTWRKSKTGSPEISIEEVPGMRETPEKEEELVAA